MTLNNYLAELRTTRENAIRNTMPKCPSWTPKAENRMKNAHLLAALINVSTMEPVTADEFATLRATVRAGLATREKK